MPRNKSEYNIKIHLIGYTVLVWTRLVWIKTESVSEHL